MPLAAFSEVEIFALLGDPEVARLGRACVDAIREGCATPLAEALAEGRSGLSPDLLLRKAAFAAAIQGLSPRVAALPGGSSLPEALAERLALEAEWCAARGRLISERLRTVLALLAGAGAEAIPLKGAALVARGEADASLRPMGDLDLLLVDPSRLTMAAAALTRETKYRPLLDTPRHLVLAEEDERVASPGAEHPGNPLRIELHRSFRLPVLGVVLEATEELVSGAETTAEGIRVPSAAAMFRHLRHHAAEDYASRGLRAIQAVDFLDLARRSGPLSSELPAEDAAAAAPLLYAADGIERLFPGTFEAASLERLASRVPPSLRARAAELPVLRHTRPSRGFTRTGLALAPHRRAAARFLLRSAFPSLGEVKANVAPGADGLALRVEWLRVLGRRVASILR